MSSRHTSRVYSRVVLSLSLIVGWTFVSKNLTAATVTQLENAKQGSADWQLTNPATNHEIEGFASLTSVNRGSQISFLVSTSDPTYTLEVFRMGWYSGAGARRMMSPVQLNGTKQVAPVPDPVTGMVECQWTNAYTLAIPFDPDQTVWASGVYLVRLTGNASGKQSYIIFIVRDDARSSKYLYQLSMNTFQAYNNWGGKSLYGWNSTNSVAAVNVSFNRPYAMGNQASAASGVGAGEFLTNVQPATEVTAGGWGYNMVRFLEREGYDVSYISDVDAHENGNLLLSHKALLVVGHSEYWSWQMRTNVQAARDANVGIGFFSSNTSYWQIRFGASPITGAPDRTIIAYKNVATDPYASNPSTANLTTTLWRSSPVNLPEEALVGTMYGTDHVNSDIIVSNSSHWVYTFTGLQNGAHLPGLLGYEIDYMQGHQPATTVGVAHEITASGMPADTTVYTAASGATVFATGSFQWSWGLDDYNVPVVRTSVINPAVQQITRNVLARLAGDPFVPTFSSILSGSRAQIVSSGSNVSYTITTTAYGYTPTLTLSLAGLPANVPYSFSPPTLTGSGSSTLTISPNASSSAGNYLITIGVSDGTQIRTDLLSLSLGNVVPKTSWKLVYADSQETQCENGAAVNGFDGSAGTIWHSQYCPTTAQLPHEIQIDMGTALPILGFRYLPRQDGGTHGRIGLYEFYATNDLSNWGTPLATGTFANDATEKEVLFPLNTYRYIRLRALTEANGGPWASMAELTVLQTSASSPALTSVAVTPSNPTMFIGGTQQFKAMGTFQGGATQDITSQANWSSSTSAAKITTSGMATGQTAGTSIVTAGLSGINGSTSVNVQAASGSLVAVPKSNWKIAFVDSQETQCENGLAANSFDSSASTIWHTQYCPTTAQLPHEIQIDMGTGYLLGGFRYLPRQDGGTHGRIGQYEFYATNNLSNWGTPLTTGTFANDATEKQVLFAANTYRYIRLRALTEANGGPWTSMAELTALQTGSGSSLSVSSTTLSPTSVTGNSSSQGTVTLSGIAPSGGAVVTLSSSNTIVAVVPATVTVPANASTATFTVNTSGVSSTTPVTISASYGGGTASAVLSVTAPSPISTNGWSLAYVDSQETQCENGAAVNGFDGNFATIWHTQYCPTTAQLPHEIQIDMGTANLITGFRYLPRQDGGTHGRIGQFEFYATNNLSNWGIPLATGTFANDAALKQVQFVAGTYRYIRLRALTEVSGGLWTSMAELSVF